MEQNGFLKNISGTVCVIGLALTTMSFNSTMVVDGSYKIPSAKYNYSDYSENTTNSYVATNNIYVEKKNITRLEKEATALFGIMRDATPEEKASVNKYIKSISKNTGVNFFDLC